MTTVVVDGAGDEPAPAETQVAPDAIDAAATAQIATADAAVEIAAIEAQRDVAIAEIQAETSEDEAWLRNELAEFRARSDAHAQTLETMAVRLESMEARMSELMTSLIPPPPSMEPEPQPETAAQNPSENLESGAADGRKESREVAQESRVRRRRWLA